MEDATRELAVQALNDLLKTISHYAKERPYDTEVITALSTGITAILPIASNVPISDLIG